MIKRCVEISGEGYHLKVHYNQLILMREKEQVAQIPVEDLGVLVVDNPSVTWSNSAISSLMENNVALVICGKNHLPSGFILPIDGHSTQVEGFAFQAAARDSLKKKLWTQVVKAKIRNQADVLEVAGKNVGGFKSLVRKVKSGDPTNVEAQAAQKYWPLLMGAEFRRRRDGEPPNNMLNYGYAVLRASTARALVGAGLHPSLGIHHRNRFDTFALADDLMEPMRPFVDIAVYELWESGEDQLSPDCKKKLLGTFAEPVEWEGQNSPLMIALQRAAASLRRALAGEQKEIMLPGIMRREAPT